MIFYTFLFLTDVNDSIMFDKTLGHFTAETKETKERDIVTTVLMLC